MPICASPGFEAEVRQLAKDHQALVVDADGKRDDLLRVIAESKARAI